MDILLMEMSHYKYGIHIPHTMLHMFHYSQCLPRCKPTHGNVILRPSRGSNGVH